MTGGLDEHAAGPRDAAPATYGEQVSAGVARAALLDRLLREPQVVAALETLTSDGDGPRIDPSPGEAGGPVAHAIAAAKRTSDAPAATLAEGRGLAGIGSWLPAFLLAAMDFRRALDADDLGRCVLVDPDLREARAYVRSCAAEPETYPWIPRAPVLQLMGGLLPAAEPADWTSRTPDWVELFVILVEHAAERPDWTVDATGTDRLWPFLLLSDFVKDVELGDDPDVLHGLIGLWANACHQTIDAYTRPRLPRGRVPAPSGVYRDGRPREGGREKIRRWVGWYIDKELRRIPFNDILRAAFPSSAAPLERASEVRRHIRKAEYLLGLELPLAPGQPVRLWELAQANRALLALLPPEEGVKSLGPASAP